MATNTIPFFLHNTSQGLVKLHSETQTETRQVVSEMKTILPNMSDAIYMNITNDRKLIKNT